jgi:hypothetical protein
MAGGFLSQPKLSLLWSEPRIVPNSKRYIMGISGMTDQGPCAAVGNVSPDCQESGGIPAIGIRPISQDFTLEWG